MAKVYLTDYEQLVPRIGRCVTVGEHKLALFRMSDGQVAALADLCPLTGWPIMEGTVSQHYVYEPMRDYKISLLDGQVQEPDEGQVKVYPLEVIDGKIYTQSEYL